MSSSPLDPERNLPTRQGMSHLTSTRPPAYLEWVIESSQARVSGCLTVLSPDAQLSTLLLLSSSPGLHRRLALQTLAPIPAVAGLSFPFEMDQGGSQEKFVVDVFDTHNIAITRVERHGVSVQNTRAYFV